MPLPLAQAIVILLAVYAGAGALFALVFVTVGVPRVDPAARNAPVLFRVLISPGVAALWPLLLRRWIVSRGAPPDTEPAP